MTDLTYCLQGIHKQFKPTVEWKNFMQWHNNENTIQITVNLCADCKMLYWKQEIQASGGLDDTKA